MAAQLFFKKDGVASFALVCAVNLPVVENLADEGVGLHHPRVEGVAAEGTFFEIGLFRALGDAKMAENVSAVQAVRLVEYFLAD